MTNLDKESGKNTNFNIQQYVEESIESCYSKWDREGDGSEGSDIDIVKKKKCGEQYWPHKDNVNQLVPLIVVVGTVKGVA